MTFISLTHFENIFFLFGNPFLEVKGCAMLLLRATKPPTQGWWIPGKCLLTNFNLIPSLLHPPSHKTLLGAGELGTTAPDLQWPINQHKWLLGHKIYSEIEINWNLISAASEILANTHRGMGKVRLTWCEEPGKASYRRWGQALKTDFTRRGWGAGGRDRHTQEQGAGER